MNLKSPIKELNRVGKSTALALKRLNIFTAEDLLFWFPFRYEDFRRIVPVKDLADGESVTVRARVELINNKRSFRSRRFITEALLADDSGSVRLVWFNQPFIAKILKPGDVLFVSGKVKSDMLGPQFVNPVYEKETNNPTAHTARLVPIYPVVHGLTQKQMRFLMAQIMPAVDEVKEWMPKNILEKFDLSPLADAVRGIHFPADEIELKQASDRLKFDELFLPQLKAEMVRLNRELEKAPAMIFKEEQIKEFVRNLPFELTKTQKISAWEILRDLGRPAVMNRMLSGDVGSGKTVVAALALYNTVLNGYQGVLMAPTEILARQHFDTLEKLFGDKLAIVLLTRGQNKISGRPLEEISKNDVLQMIGNGKAQIVVGTHALLTDKVVLNNVGLVVVDEQHRFGVGQRKAIKDKTASIDSHYLSMTATPIPRSLALAIYGDLDLSIINELPAGRCPIITRLVEEKNRAKAYDFIREQVRKGRQVFVICPLIEREPADKERPVKDEFIPINYNFYSIGGDETKSVMTEYDKLSKQIFPELKVGFLHGRLKPAEKEAAMRKFRQRELDILVSTSVVEVGVDISNASVMMIEGAERFGLAQLHQFRGRVGRSVHQSYCLLFTDSSSGRVNERLTFFEKNLDGFKLAEKDLETRGPGEVYGTEQSGLMNLRLAKLTDKTLIKKAREAAKLAVLELKKNSELRAKISHWETKVHQE
jgi:ATP-dependent DNA helicase RecG